MGGGDRVQSTGHVKLSDKIMPYDGIARLGGGLRASTSHASFL